MPGAVQTMNDDIYEMAALWLQAQARDGMDWQAFTSWLEADPRHREAFDDVALLDERVDGLRGELRRDRADNDVDGGAESVTAHGRGRLWRWGGAAAAAGIILAVGGAWLSRPVEPLTYAAATGVNRNVAVADGLSATVSGGSRLTVRGAGRLSLQGSAFFDVRHDPSRAVVVDVSGYEIRDVGTRFEVASDGVSVRVAVTQGAVTIRAPGSASSVRVDAGYAATGSADGQVTLNRTDLTAVGSWRSGRFVYDRVPLSLVAADISRFTGEPVRTEATVGGQTFSGVLARGSRDSMVESLRQLAGVRTRREGDAILLGPDPRR